MRPILFFPTRIALPGDAQRLELIPIDLEKTPFDDFSSVLFGTPFKLQWYNVCLDNRNKVLINDTEVTTPYLKDPEAGAMTLHVDLQNKSTNEVYAPVNKKVCKYIKVDNVVANITPEYRRPDFKSFDPVLKRPKSDNVNEATLEQSSAVDTKESSIILLNRWDEFLYKIIIFIIGWMLLFVGVVETWKYSSKWWENRSEF